MKRRAVIATFGAGLTLGSGCLSRMTRTTGAPGGRSDPTETPADSTSTEAPNDSTEGSDDSTTADDSGDVDDRTDRSNCPPFADDADETVCYADRDDDTPVYIEPSTRQFEVYPHSDDVETMSFTLHNENGTTFSFNPYDWELRKQTDSGRKHVAPDAVPEPMAMLESGETHAWTLATEIHPSPRETDANHITADLESGRTYAFQIAGFYETTSIDHGTPETTVEHTTKELTKVECIAIFDYLEAVP